MFRTVVVAVLAAAVVPACTTNVVIVEQVVTSTSGDESPGLESTSTGEPEDTGTTEDSTSTSTTTDESSTSTGEESTTTTTDESTGTSTDMSTGNETEAFDSTSTGTTAVMPHCGDGIVDEAEDCDGVAPFDGVGCTDACTYDFSEVPQMFCQGSCSWAGPSGCDQADADLFCRLRTGNPNASATSFTLAAPTDDGGFPCEPRCRPSRRRRPAGRARAARPFRRQRDRPVPAESDREHARRWPDFDHRRRHAAVQMTTTSSTARRGGPGAHGERWPIQQDKAALPRPRW